MCGIFGYAGDPSHPAFPELMSNLALYTSLRGGDATGIAYYMPPTDKAPVGMWYNKESHEVAKWLRNGLMVGAIEDGCRLMIGHCRLATHGDASTKNNHPHFTNDGRVAIVHNGVIFGYRYLDSQFNLVRGGECDSETIAKLVGHFMHDVPPKIAARKPPILDALEELDDAHGDFAVAALDASARAIFLFRNHSNPLHYCTLPGMGVTIFASDADHIHQAICDTLGKRARRNLGYRKETSIRSLMAGRVLALKRDGTFVYSRETRILHDYHSLTPKSTSLDWESYADRYSNPDLPDITDDLDLIRPYSWTPKGRIVNLTPPKPMSPETRSSLRHLLTAPEKSDAKPTPKPN